MTNGGSSTYFGIVRFPVTDLPGLIGLTLSVALITALLVRLPVVKTVIRGN